MESPAAPERRTARRGLWGGILFSLIFTVLIWAAGGRLDQIELLPDQGASWYYWKLPEPTIWSRITSWGLYALHQIAFWGSIYYAQKKTRRYTAGLHRINVVTLGVNAFFIVPYYPLWSIIVIVLTVMVIYALTVKSDEMEAVA